MRKKRKREKREKKKKRKKEKEKKDHNKTTKQQHNNTTVCMWLDLELRYLQVEVYIDQTLLSNITPTDLFSHVEGRTMMSYSHGSTWSNHKV